MGDTPNLTYYSGIVHDGPLKGRTHVASRRRVDHESGTGFYVHVPQKGPEAAHWRWVPNTDLDKPDPLGR